MTQYAPGEQPEPRESIWSVDPRWKPIYFYLFTALNASNTGRVIWKYTVQTDHEGWSAVLDAAIDDISRGSIASAGASLALTEFGRISMVIGGHLQDVLRRRNERKLAESMAKGMAEGRAKGMAEGRAKGMAEGRTEGRTEGEAEANTRWRAWYSRLLEAQARGEPFDEPPPDGAPRSDNDQS